MRAAFNEPFERFEAVFSRAAAAHPKDPNAVTLATVSGQGRPSARVVLLKGFDARGFVFFTNYRSRKGRELFEQKAAALCFYWPELDEQVRVEGDAEPTSAAESDAYFASRPRSSQLGAWASHQSEVLESRPVLVARLDEVTRRFAGAEVPRPPHWGGFVLTPRLIEFWKSGEHRLHERTCYTRAEEGWDVELLNP